jgi:hypothetical protein
MSPASFDDRHGKEASMNLVHSLNAFRPAVMRVATDA